MAGLLNAEADEVVFISGGSEANNAALKGAFPAVSALTDTVAAMNARL